MEIKMDSVMFRKFTHDMLQVGRLDMAIQLGLTKTTISQRQAFKRFGESRVKTWESRGLISSVKEKGNTSKRNYSVVDLEILYRSEKYG